jgi:citrate lyase subunit beta / citryl-CoA lyase
LRSFLFAPGNHARRVANALSLNADAVILDLEDAVATAEKRAACNAAVAALALARQPLLYVWVNAADTEFCYGDLVAIVRPGLDRIVLPKIESAAALATIYWLLAQWSTSEVWPPERAISSRLSRRQEVSAALNRSSGPARASGVSGFGAGDFTLDVKVAWAGPRQSWPLPAAGLPQPRARRRQGVL